MTKRLLIIALVAVIGAASITAIRYATTARAAWPELLKTMPGEPRYNFEVKPGFGWRTGNHVPVSLYFQSTDDNRVLPDQLSLAGDFRLVDSQVHEERKKDEYYTRIDLTLQTFTYKPKWAAVATIGYHTRSGAIARLRLLPIEVSSSKTFDGAKSKHPKEPDVALLPGGHLLTLALVLAGGFLIVWSVPRLHPPGTPAVQEPASTSPTGFDAIDADWRAITDGERSPEAFRRFAASVRAHFGIEDLTVTELRQTDLPEKTLLVCVLSVCEKVLWKQEELDQTDIDHVATSLEELHHAASDDNSRISSPETNKEKA